MQKRIRKSLVLCLFGVTLMAFHGISHGQMVSVNTSQLQALLDDGVPLIDVRTEPEWKDLGVVEGSIKLTFFDEKGNYDANQWLNDAMEQIGEAKSVALICHTGVRSKVIANWLGKGQIFDQVYNVQRGIDAWLRNGLPVDK